MNIDQQIEKALNFAVTQHAGQFRKGTGIPYVAHVLDVLKQVALWGICKSEENVDLWTTAIIHDTFEDGDTSLELIAELFNKRVAYWVSSLSFRKKEEGEFDAMYQADKSAHFDKLEHADVEVIVIKLADRICNVYDFLESDHDYACKYYKRGKGIISAFKKRIDDITIRFGRKSSHRMELEVLSLEMKLGVDVLERI